MGFLFLVFFVVVVLVPSLGTNEQCQVAVREGEKNLLVDEEEGRNEQGLGIWACACPSGKWLALVGR